MALWSIEENIMYKYCGHKLIIFFFLFCILWPNCTPFSQILVYYSKIVPILSLSKSFPLSFSNSWSSCIYFFVLVNHGLTEWICFLILVNCGQIAQTCSLVELWPSLVFSKSWPRTNSFPRFTELWLNCTNLFTCYSKSWPSCTYFLFFCFSKSWPCTNVFPSF